MNRYDMLEREVEKKIQRELQPQDDRYQEELRRQYSREIMLIEETLKPLVTKLDTDKKNSEKELYEIKIGLANTFKSVKAIQEELEKQRQDAQSALTQSGKVMNNVTHMIEAHLDKAKLLSNIKDWAYPLMAAILVSLLWTASLKLWLPNYNDIVSNQSQIWHKLEGMSKGQDTNSKEAGVKKNG